MPSSIEKKQSRRVMVFLVLLVLAAAYFMPFAWMVSTSLKPLNETMLPHSPWIPRPVQGYNYRDAIHNMGNFWGYVRNSLFLCVLTVIGTVISSALAAYGFSRIEWAGRDKVFLVLLGTMMIPFPVIMVPVFGLFKNISAGSGPSIHCGRPRSWAARSIFSCCGSFS